MNQRDIRSAKVQLPHQQSDRILPGANSEGLYSDQKSRARELELEGIQIEMGREGFNHDLEKEIAR